MEIVRNIEYVINKSEKMIDADLLAKLTKEISYQYNQY